MVARRRSDRERRRAGVCARARQRGRAKFRRGAGQGAPVGLLPVECE